MMRSPHFSLAICLRRGGLWGLASCTIIGMTALLVGAPKCPSVLFPRRGLIESLRTLVHRPCTAIAFTQLIRWMIGLNHNSSGSCYTEDIITHALWACSDHTQTLRHTCCALQVANSTCWFVEDLILPMRFRHDGRLIFYAVLRYSAETGLSGRL